MGGAAFIGAPFGAAVGAVIGIACALTGGLSLIIFGRYVAASRSSIRAVASCGAGFLPATWLIAVATGSGLRYVAMPAALTVVTVALAGALGPHAFYGKPCRAKTSRTARAESSPSREIVG
jgi:hypothetical protein